MHKSSDRTVTFDGDIIKIDGKPTRMTYMVREAFWAHECAIVLLDPNAYMDLPAFGAQRRRSRNPVHNLRAYSAAGELLWQAQQPKSSDHYYRIESQDPLIALSFSGFRCEIDVGSGEILTKQNIK